MNKKGAVNTAVTALTTIIVIIIIILAIYAVSQSIQKEGTPLYENFLEVLNIFKGEIQTDDPTTVQEVALSEAAGNFWEDFETCEDYPNSNCACNLRTLPFQEGSKIYLVNKENIFAMQAVTGEDTVIEEGTKSYNGNIGLAYRDTTGNIKCHFPERFYFSRGETDKGSSTGSGDWYVYWKDDRVKQVWHKAGKYKKLSFETERIISTTEIPVEFSLDEENAEVTMSYHGSEQEIKCRYDEDKKTWSYKKENDLRDSPVEQINFGIEASEQQKRLVQYLIGKNREEGLAYFREINEFINNIELDDSNENNLFVHVSELYKLENNQYCLVTDLVDIPIESTKGDLTLEEFDGSKFFSAEMKFYYSNQQYCHG